MWIDVLHHDDHRPGPALRNQAVHDLRQAAEAGPRLLVGAAAGMQVEHRVAAGSRFIAGRRIDVGPARHLQRWRGIPHQMQFAVRDARVVLVQRGCRPGDDEDARQALAVAVAVDIGGIERPNAVHRERVLPEFGRERPDRRRPDTLRVFLHGDAAVRPVAVEGHLGGLRRRQTEGYAAIGVDLGRYEGGVPGRPRGRRLAEERGGRRQREGQNPDKYRTWCHHDRPGPRPSEANRFVSGRTGSPPRSVDRETLDRERLAS